MLRYAGYIDAASNLYEVPRPPRRGSHRPAVPEVAFEPRWNAELLLPSLSRSASSSPPLHGGVVVTPLTSQHAYLGKRQMITMTTSPSLAKDPMRSVDVDCGHNASVRAQFVARSLRERSSRDEAFSQLTHDVRDDREYAKPLRDNQGESGYDEPIVSAKQERLPMRRTIRESIRDATAPLALVDLVKQLDSSNNYNSNNGRFSPTESILESYAKMIPLTASCQTVQKRCMYPACTKISVSRGLCRGHGGGRRCHSLGCSKSAQSRSNFCWAHGGGQRCEVANCMRSRKSKRFCVAHVQFEHVAQCERQAHQPGGSGYEPSARGRARMSQEPPLSCKQHMPRYLPSLGQALSSASRSPPNLPGRFNA